MKCIYYKWHIWFRFEFIKRMNIEKLTNNKLFVWRPRSIETFANGESERVSTKQEIIGDAAFVIVPVSRLSTTRACISHEAEKVLYICRKGFFARYTIKRCDQFRNNEWFIEIMANQYRARISIWNAYDLFADHSTQSVNIGLEEWKNLSV